MALIRAQGNLLLTKPLAHAMGLRRRALRALVRRMVDDGEPIALWPHNSVSLTDDRARITLDMTEDQLQTLIVALAERVLGAHRSPATAGLGES